MSFTFWLSRAALAFGLHLLYIALVLLTDSLAGSLWGFLPLVLMPLFECILGFLYCFFTYGRSKKQGLCLGTVTGALLAAGILYEIACWAVKGMSFDLGVWLYDLLVLVSLLLGSIFGIRVQRLLKQAEQRRKRFDE